MTRVRPPAWAVVACLVGCSGAVAPERPDAGDDAAQTRDAGSDAGDARASDGGADAGGDAARLACADDVAVSAVELTLCATDADCPCTELTCVDDPQVRPELGGRACERSCTSSTDCPSLSTVCDGGHCVLARCGPGTTNGVFDGTCDAEGTADGTCVPLEGHAGGYWPAELYGQCTQAGTAALGAPCTDDLFPSRATPRDMLCGPGLICIGEVGTTLHCAKECLPDGHPEIAGDTTCPEGTTCRPLPVPPFLRGVCG